MALPIQAAPIDRARRVMTAQSARGEGISPSQPLPEVICAICKIFPQIPICPLFCPT